MTSDILKYGFNVFVFIAKAAQQVGVVISAKGQH